MKLNIAKIYFLSPKIETPIIHSPTVFGGLCNAIAELEGEGKLVELLNNMGKDPLKGFAVSSGFPFFEYEQQPTKYLLPLEILNLSNRKEIKGKLVDISFFRDKGNKIDNNLESGFEVSYRARNCIMPDKTTLFSTPFIEVRKDVKSWGFWFAYRGEDEICKKAFRFLVDEGFGGDRSLGGGREYIEFTTLEIPDNGKFFMNLSLYVPTEDEIKTIKEHQCWYKLVRKDGWHEKNGVGVCVKPSMYYITEGSVFSNILKKELYGRCGEFKNLKGVWWSGITIPLYFNNDAEEVIKSLQSEQN